MIIFDIDGTLWNVAELTTEAANLVASRMPGVNMVTLEDINSIMGMGRSEIINKLYPDVERERAAEAVEAVVNTASELIDERGGNFYDGVAETIKYLSKKYKLGIVTNNTDSYVKLLLDKSGLVDCFVDYIGATSYGISKAEAIRQMVNRNQVSSACYVGDIKKIWKRRRKRALVLFMRDMGSIRNWLPMLQLMTSESLLIYCNYVL